MIAASSYDTLEDVWRNTASPHARKPVNAEKLKRLVSMIIKLSPDDFKMRKELQQQPTALIDL